MNAAVLLLLGLNYVLIVSLPFVFFEKRDRRRGPMWWIAAAPFLLLPAFLVLTGLGVLHRFVAAHSAPGEALAIFAVAPAALSIALVALALGVHQQPPPQWHQQQDLPAALVTRGPYSRVRHPFYLAYLLMFMATAAAVPTVGTLGTLIYALLILNHTAAREERRLCASQFGTAYRAYIGRSGRFLPGLAARPA